MPRKREVTIDEMIEKASEVTPREFQKIMTAYLRSHNVKQDARYTKLLSKDLETRIKQLGVNNVCPRCGKKYIRNDGIQDNGLQKLKCTQCGKKFTYTTGTMFANNQYPWDIHVDMVYYFINNMSIEKTTQNLITSMACADITEETVLNWRHKYIEAAKLVEPPILKGVVQIDETHMHEAQKGNRNLVNFFDSSEERKPRKTGEPSKYGVMGPEFETIITAIDSSGHCVFRFSGLGKFNLKRFEELFRPYIAEASYLSTDKNNIYIKYSRKYRVPHYIRPSDYLDKISKCTKESDIIALYRKDELDYIVDKRYSYKELKNLKEKLGLNLARVNSAHQRIKTNLFRKARSVSVKYIDGYIAWACLLENYRVDNGGKAATTREDAENILKILVGAKSTITIRELKAKKFVFEKPSATYIKRLKENTDRVRKKNEEFIFDSSYLSDSNSIRSQLDDLPVGWLKELAKNCKIKNRSQITKDHKRNQILDLLKVPDIRERIIDIYAKNGFTIINEKDL